MDPIAELLAEIARDPVAAGPQLVLGDQLIAAGDPRGELIILNHLDLTTDLRDRDAVERLLLLAAEYTFPDPLDRKPPAIAFDRRSGMPVEYLLEMANSDRYYHVSYRDRHLILEVGRDGQVSSFEYPIAEDFPTDVLELSSPRDPAYRTTDLILQIISDAILSGTPFPPLQFPFMRNPLPVYDAGPVRCYRLPSTFTEPRRLAANRYGLAARDFRRWHDLLARLDRV
jgi:hypothetical protein